MDNFQILHDYAIGEILSYLTCGELLDAMLVCKKWKHFIRHFFKHKFQLEVPKNGSVRFMHETPSSVLSFYTLESEFVPPHILFDINMTNQECVRSFSKKHGSKLFGVSLRYCGVDLQMEDYYLFSLFPNVEIMKLDFDDDCSTQDTIWAPDYPRLHNLRSLELCVTGGNHEVLYRNFSDMTSNLECLAIDDPTYNSRHQLVLNSILKNNSKTLKEITIKYGSMVKYPLSESLKTINWRKIDPETLKGDKDKTDILNFLKWCEMTEFKMYTSTNAKAMVPQIFTTGKYLHKLTLNTNLLPSGKLLKELPSLRELHIIATQLVISPPSQKPEKVIFKNLQILSISAIAKGLIDQQSYATFLQCVPNIKKLTLHMVHLHTSVMKSIYEHTKKLTYFHIIYATLEDDHLFPLDSKFSINSLSGIRDFRLDCRRLTDSTISRLRLPKLKSIYLYNINKITTFGIKQLALVSPEIVNFQVFVFEKSEFGARCVKEITSNWPKMHTLKLIGSWDVRDATVNSIIRNCRVLRYLKLCGKEQISPFTRQILGNSIQTLRVYDNRIDYMTEQFHE